MLKCFTDVLISGGLICSIGFGRVFRLFHIMIGKIELRKTRFEFLDLLDGWI